MPLLALFIENGFHQVPRHLVFTKGCTKLGVDRNDHLPENGKGVHFLAIKAKIKLLISKYTVITRLKTEAKHGASKTLRNAENSLYPTSPIFRQPA